MRALLLTATFVGEIVVLAACAVAAYRWPGALVLRWSTAALAVLVMAVLWGVLAAPRAARRLTGAASLAFRVAWFGVGVLATGWVLGPAAGGVLAAACAVTALGLRLSGRSSTADQGAGGVGQ